jgi:C-terminal processing protease CtpA/Prc
MAQNGEDIYNKGFSPDIRMLPTVEGFQAGQDPVFDKALEIIRGKISG